MVIIGSFRISISCNHLSSFHVFLRLHLTHEATNFIHRVNQRILIECVSDPLMVGTGARCTGIQNRDHASILLGADQTTGALLQLDQHLGCGIAVDKVQDIAKLLFLKFHHLTPRRERQTNDDHRGKDITGTVNAFHMLPEAKSTPLPLSLNWLIASLLLRLIRIRG